MSEIARLASSVRALRPFLPARDYEASLRFYQLIGFDSFSLGPAMAELSLGTHAFLLHQVDAPTEGFVMHVLVENVRSWWKHIESLNLSRHFDVPQPTAPRAEPWGLTVLYVTDPAGNLWHFAEDSESHARRGSNT